MISDFGCAAPDFFVEIFPGVVSGLHAENGKSRTMNRKTKGWLMVAALAGLAGCDRIDPQWKGWVYPDRNDPSVDWKLGTFASLKECREAAQSMIRWLPDKDSADYECGYQCKPSDFLGRLDVCTETRQ